MVGLDVAVFISHSWSHPKQYYELTGLLNSLADLSWKDVSVERHAPLQSQVRGEPAQQQELTLQREKLARLVEERQRLASLVWRHQSEASAVDAKREQRRELRQEIEAALKSPFSTWMIQMTEDRHGTSWDHLIAQAQEDIEEPVSTSDLERASERLAKLDRWIGGCERRIEQIRADSGLGVTLIRYDSRDVFNKPRKVPEEAIDEDRNLALMLEAKIAAADVVIVVANLFSQYRRWMAFELAVAQTLSKPLIAVVPDGQANCPRELEVRCNAVVRWEAAALGKALIAVGANA